MTVFDMPATLLYVVFGVLSVFALIRKAVCARACPLGSGHFHLFAIRDLGVLRLPCRFRRAWDASILEDPRAFGFETCRIGGTLRVAPDSRRPFPVNVDGSSMTCESLAEFRIVAQIRLISREQ